jgi:hypothetical protein
LAQITNIPRCMFGPGSEQIKRPGSLDETTRPLFLMEA